ncbi:beta-hexosaminidase subunit beta-like [Dreissena polymorpha]|uniref:beta-hexosaminidase subunit beta-like n=1 Tax=Dreissena polymorpha TaxID=45954 RepID=UPI002264A2A4|nr:beta-hexosaminidase subunit beta-like [Dreissena polymorpha]
MYEGSSDAQAKQMYVWLCLFLACSAAVKGEDVKASLLKLGMKFDPAPPGVNPYLQKFLDVHSRPKVTFAGAADSNTFNLKMTETFDFKPPIRKSPFSSTGEPWPMPYSYHSNKEKVLRLLPEKFSVKVTGHTCNILEKAVERYNKIIARHIIEEQYNFIYNFDERTRELHERAVNVKYEHVTDMSPLQVHVNSDECGYPHVNMNESYILVVNGSECKLEAGEVWGALRGLETFSQILFRKTNTDQIYCKETEIYDQPRFAHRGILIDTSRHFIEKYVIKNVLDGMAYSKLNVLHWHIVDDNSFPYQSQVYPKLSEQGAYHQTLVYSLDDIRELVEYARLRGIRVVPEFDTPGHTFAWFGYPELKSTCYQRNGQPVQGPIGPIDPTNNVTYSFMSNLFAEIYDVFPDEFVHLGGDELHTDCWATNPSIVHYLQEHANIPAFEARTNAQLYVNKAIGYYFSRLIKTLEATAAEKTTTRHFLMWEDVLKNTKEVPAGSILQVWSGRQTNVLNLNQQGYRALYSSCWYLDNHRPYPMWQEYYQCEPSPYTNDADEKDKLLGGEACLWAEFITSDTLMTTMWPNAFAPAERLWSPRNVRDFELAKERIQEQRCRFIYRGLPTGHISGPDYCLQYKEGPLGGPDGINEDDSATGVYKEPNVVIVRGQADDRDTGFAFNESPSGKTDISLNIISDFSAYLPMANMGLTLSGVGLVVLVTRNFYRRRRMC